ncbi:MAG: HYR domain-containing protein, partial [Bacteroidales bacterium]|nr:HYR domain-containing protein [Bacteroidales bacterium]
MKVFTLKKHGILNDGHYKPDSGGSGGKLTTVMKRLSLFLLLMFSMSIVNGQTITNVFQSDPSGCTNTDGQIIIIASGGVAPIEYSIDGGANYLPTGVFTNLSGGSYTVQIRDAAPTIVVWGANPVVLYNTDAVAIQGSSTIDASCFGVSDGSVTVVVDYPNSGSTQPFSFSLSDGVNTPTVNATGIFTALPAATYSVTVTNDACSEVVSGLVVDEPDEIQIAVSSAPASCDGDSDGTVTATATDGNAPYFYVLKDNGGNIVASNSIGSFTGLAGGDYTVEATDSNPCTNSASITVGNPSALSFDAVTSQDIDCNGNGNGEIHVTVSGGTTPYVYYLDKGLTSEVSNASGDFTGLSQGDYLVSVDDAGPCSLVYASNPVTIAEPVVLSISSVVDTDITSCNGLSEGVIDITAAGGTSPLQYSIDAGGSWHPGGTFSALAAGSYTVMVKDDNACAVAYASNPVILTEPTEVVMSNVAVTDVTCFAGTDGEMTITAAGGTGDLFYSVVPTGDAASYGAAGINTVTGLAAGTYDVQVKDANDCESGAQQEDVIVVDTEDPVAVCMNITVQLDSNGEVSITGADVDGGSTDNCAIASIVPSITDFTCADIGGNPIDVTVTDSNGNTDACVCVVTVEDILPPTAICQDITVSLDAGGSVTIAASDINDGSSDNCGITSMSIDNATFDCTNTGANTVTLTVEDSSGNTDECVATVTVVDDIDPTAVCSNTTIQLSASGTASIVAADIDGGSSDNCTFTLSASQTDFICTDLGPNTVTLTAEDASGNTNYCLATVTVEDNIDPVAVCQNIVVPLDGTGNVSITTAQIDNGSSDNCGIDNMSLDFDTFDCTDIGVNPVTLTVVDIAGNTDECYATVTVEDNTDPIAACQNITVSLDAGGSVTIVAGDVNDGSSDNCGITSMSIDNDTFDCTNTGANTVTLTVEDSNGNTDFCIATVTVEDDTNPTAVCSNTTIQLSASGTASIVAADIDGGSSDNCTFTLTASQTDFDCTDVGPVTVTLTAEDASGNTDFCLATVTVEDDIDPVAVCQVFTLELDNTGNAILDPADLDGGSTDNCSGNLVFTADQTAFDCSDIGDVTVTLTVTDPGGNFDVCVTTVTVEDNVDPVAICQTATIALDATGNATLVAADVDNGSSDNCSILFMSVTPNGFGCDDVGDHTVTLYVQDSNGNTGSCTTTITVEDNILPIAVCQDIGVNLDASGQVTIAASDLDDGSTDNCDLTFSASQLLFDCSDLGPNSVTLTATDQGGNTDFCIATVTVSDIDSPVALCQDITVELDASGAATIVAEDLDDGSTDNCSMNFSASQTSFDCSDIGDVTVTLTVTDDGSNTDFCIATVTVEDNIDPTPVCQDVVIQLDASGNASTTAAAVDNGSSDNCSVAGLSLDQTAFTCADIGANTVTLTVEDSSGNTAECTATVTVEDNIAPVASCVGNFTIQLDANGVASISTVDVDFGSTDNCGIDNMSLDIDSFDCTDVGGAVTVTLTVEDAAGNSDDCTVDVTVQDNVDPVAVCQNFDAYLDAAGNVTVLPGDVNNGSNDACGIAAMTIDGGASVTFGCADVGPNTVTLEVTDSNGNTDNCTATVTVIDDVDPTALCQDVTIQLDASGDASTTAAAVDNGSSDACGIASLSLDQTAFTCADLGPNTVTLTAIDSNGNTSTCTATVTVQDIISPVANCIAGPFVAQLDANGSVTVYPTDFDNISTDNCTIDDMTINGAASITYTCADVAAGIPITLVIFDQSGNSSSCVTSVDVEDNVDPTAICQDIDVTLDGSGNASIVPADINNGSNDACGISGMTLDIMAFTCADIGENTVTLEVTDSNGNTDECTAVVTVSDEIDPTAICQDAILDLDVNGEATLTIADIDNGSSDNCSVASLTLDQTAFTCADIGDHTVTLTVEDSSGNTAECTATVTVRDVMDPNVLCLNSPTIELDATGNVFITPADIDNGSTDNCNIASMTLSQQLFSCGDVGAPIAVTLTVTDDEGNSAFCISNITIVDVTDPNAVCQDITVNLDVTGNVLVAGADLDNGSSDACGIDFITVSPNAFDCTDIGPNPVVVTVQDENGNTSTCDAIITVQDIEAPVAVCQDITIQLDTDGDVHIVAADIDGGSTDNCDFTLAASQLDFTCADIGPNSVTLTVTDDGGNTDICVATVTVEDILDPIAICQDFTAELDETGNVTVLATDIDNGSSDNCSIASMVVSPNTFTCADVGDHSVTLTITDSSGNDDECIATVTVEDNIGPDLTCPADDEIFIAAGCTVLLPDYSGALVATDNCGSIASVVQSPAAGFAYFGADTGDHTIEFTVTDSNGNSSTCDFTVTVTDDLAFTIDNVASTDITCNAADDGTITIVATGSTGGDLYYSIDNGGSYGAAGVNAFTGLIAGSYNVMVKNDNDCEVAYASNPVVIIEPAALSFLAVLQQPPLCNGGNDGEIMVLAIGGHGTYEYSIDDANSWQSSHIFTGLTAGFYEVWVRDAAHPACDLYYGAPFEVTQPPAIQIDNVVINDVTCFGGSDGDMTINASGGSGDLYFSVGAVGDAPVYGVANDNFFDNLTAGDYDVYIMDDHDCEYGPDVYTIIVGDVTPPVALCLDITVQLDATGNVSITTADIDNGSSDNCAIASMSLDQTDFTCTDVNNPVTVTLTVIDSNGNQSTCSAVVTVEDNIAPDAVCQDITVQLDASGDASIVAADIDNGSSDACGIASMTVTPDAFTCAEVGPNTVTLTV